MTPAEEQQASASLANFSQDIKALLALIRNPARQRSVADQKARGWLVSIAHKR
jgi:hypothetical protein